MVLLLSLAATLGAQEGGDLQAQILYAYQTEDLGELGNLTQRLGNQVKAGGADAALRYHLAHAEYRFGLLAARQRRKAAAPAFSDCVDQLKWVLDQDAKSVEALALQSACYRELAKERHLEAVLLRTRADERLKSAPSISRRAIRGCCISPPWTGWRASKPQLGASINRRSRTAAEAAQLFEQSSATRADVPGWGHAEAYLALGMQLAARGDVLGARNWIEKSLIVAPDYKAAQKQLASLVQR